MTGGKNVDYLLLKVAVRQADKGLSFFFLQEKTYLGAN